MIESPYDKKTPAHNVFCIRGSNAVGKSTMVRQFIGLHTDAELIKVEYQPDKFAYVTKFGNNLFALGRYDITSSGVDRYSGKEMVFQVMKYIIENYSPSCVVLEGVIWGYTFKSSEDMARYISKYGYQYFVIALERKFQSVIALLERRNKGSDYNIQSVQTGFDNQKRTTKNMIKSGLFPVKVLDADKIKYSDMGEVLAGYVYGQ